jgi:hypothetical protein
VRNNEDKSIGALDGFDEVRLSDDVVSKVDTGEVLLVFVSLVDDFGDLAALKLREGAEVSLRSLLIRREGMEGTYVFLEAPHLDLRVEAVTALLDVLTDESGDGRTPVAASYTPQRGAS